MDHNSYPPKGAEEVFLGKKLKLNTNPIRKTLGSRKRLELENSHYPND